MFLGQLNDRGAFKLGKQSKLFEKCLFTANVLLVQVIDDIFRFWTLEPFGEIFWSCDLLDLGRIQGC